jgi:hypothetical protein
MRATSERWSGRRQRTLRQAVAVDGVERGQLHRATDVPVGFDRQSGTDMRVDAVRSGVIREQVILHDLRKLRPSGRIAFASWKTVSSHGPPWVTSASMKSSRVPFEVGVKEYVRTKVGDSNMVLDY